MNYKKIINKLILILFCLLFPLNAFGYEYYTSCSTGSKLNCYNSIKENCRKKYPTNRLNAQTQYDLAGCVSDSMYTILPGWDTRLYQSWLLSKSYFAAALNNQIPFYKALELNNIEENRFNASKSNNNNQNSARQRCLSSCLMNNTAGSGFGGAISGLAACNQQCP